MSKVDASCRSPNAGESADIQGNLLKVQQGGAAHKSPAIHSPDQGADCKNASAGEPIQGASANTTPAVSSGLDAVQGAGADCE